ncbi:unnamed protein product, partial [Ixodes hexagonus]
YFFSFQGLGSVASIYPDDNRRSKVMGFTLGGAALGVLVGYPYGGVLYDFVGKTTPFAILASFSFILSVLCAVLALPSHEESPQLRKVSTFTLLADPYVLLVTGAVGVSTSAIAILEPCLPIWLMDALAPSKWQLGTVFIPDSLGYLIGTNCFGSLALTVGRKVWRMALICMVLVAVSAALIPQATSMLYLVVPHFVLGLAIGIIDAALMPLLALLVDSRHGASYGTVYAIAETAVSIAYCFGPGVAGYLVKAIGFPWVMRAVAMLNLLYCPLCLLLRDAELQEEKNALIMNRPASSNYEAVEAAGVGYTRFNGETEGE